MGRGEAKAAVAAESAMQKMPTGIQGFDEITGGGLPRARTTLVTGDPGTGKTIFALQSLISGLREWSEPGIFVAFEEPPEQIVQNATFGWDAPALSQDEIFFVDAHLSPDTVRAGEFDLAGMLGMLAEKGKEIGATRVVFDSLDVMLRLMDDPARREEVYRIREWLAVSGLTGIITARVGGRDGDWPTEFGFLPYIADCVVSLSHWIELRVSLRSLRVVKYRGSRFVESVAPMVIGPRGIEVANVGRSGPPYVVSDERISTGLEGLDRMLEGGYLRATSTLVTGAPGTAKTTLAGLFAETNSSRGEPTLYICFDEGAEEIVRNLRSVGVDLQPHLESRVLRMVSARSESRSADEHLLRIEGLIQEQRPRHLVIDPVSAITKAGGSLPALSVARRLIYRTKEEGISLLCTSLLAGAGREMESTPLEISTLADTWIHLLYQEQQGERNRALSIVKSRGTGHSNQMRELVLTDDAVQLRDIYTAGGEVLMGTLRWVKERELELERERWRAEIERRQQELRLAEAEAEARMRVIEREIAARNSELAALTREVEAKELTWRSVRHGIRAQREGADGTHDLEETRESQHSPGSGA